MLFRTNSKFAALPTSGHRLLAFYFFAICTWLHGTIWCAVKDCCICYIALTKKLQPFGTKNSALDFFGNVYMAELYFFVSSLLPPSRHFGVSMLIVSDKNYFVSVFGPFWYQKQCILLFSNLYLAAYDYLVCTLLPQKLSYSLQQVLCIPCS